MQSPLEKNDKLVSSKRDSQNLFIIFTVGERNFALPVKSVLTVIQAVKITIVEGLSKNILGVIDFHGEIVPVLDLHTDFTDAKAALRSTSSLILIFQAEGRTLGALVDSVENVIKLSESQLYSEQSHFTENKLLQLIKVEKGIIVLKDLCGQVNSTDESLLTNLSSSQGDAT